MGAVGSVIGVHATGINTLPDLSKADIIHVLNRLPLAEIGSTLAGVGGHDISLVDLAETGLAIGTSLGPGPVAGEVGIVIIFGMPQGFMRPAKRWRIVVSHRNGHVLDVLQIEPLAK